MYACFCEVDHDAAPLSQWCEPCRERYAECIECRRIVFVGAVLGGIPTPYTCERCRHRSLRGNAGQRDTFGPCAVGRDGWVCTMPAHDTENVPHVAWDTARRLCAVWFDGDVRVTPTEIVGVTS